MERGNRGQGVKGVRSSAMLKTQGQIGKHKKNIQQPAIFIALKM
jgi:hypothetical protein